MGLFSWSQLQGRKGMLQRFASPTRRASQEREEQQSCRSRAGGRGLCPGRSRVRPPGEGRSHGGSNPLLPEAARSPLLPFSPRIRPDKRLPRQGGSFVVAEQFASGFFLSQTFDAVGPLGRWRETGPGGSAGWSAMLNLVEGEQQPQFWGEAAPRAVWVWIPRGSIVVMCLF